MSDIVGVSTAPTVVLERIELPHADGAVLGIVRLDEPARLNPLSRSTFRQVRDALGELRQDEMVRAVAITGTGRAFSAGGDLTAYRTLQRDPVAFPLYMDEVGATLELPSRMGQPVVALINGIAAAGGLELALSCDFAWAARSARLGDAHMNYGQMGGGGALSVLPRLIGLPRARELVFSGRMLSADEALAWGLVNRVVEDDELLPTMIEFATMVARHSGLALANAKRVMTTGFLEGTGAAAASRVEREAVLRYVLTSQDAPEGLRAFAEKRRGRFEGR